MFFMGFASNALENIAAVPPLSAKALLAQVRAAIPKKSLQIKGKLMKGERIGRLKPALLFEARLEWGQTPPTARYTLSDSFGTPLARLTIIRPTDRAPEFRYEQGQPFRPAPTPDLNQPVENTDITWNDLSLSFLWWPNGRVMGRDNIRGRDCNVIEIPIPPAAAIPAAGTKAPSPRPADAGACIRLWIDDQLTALIQMEEYNAEGKLLRRLSVKNFKKIADQWMIKNMDIRRYPSRHRTQVRIEDVISNTTSNTSDMDLR